MLLLLLLSLWTLKFSNTSAIFFKHFLGIFGTFLIFGAEILYTARKKKQIKFGRVRRWLQTHIVIGIAGPILILFHAGFSFYRFSGIALFLTLLVALSGFFGRYVFKLIPKTIKGREQSLEQLRAKEANISAELKELLKKEVPGMQPPLLEVEMYKGRSDLLRLLAVSFRTYQQRILFKQQLKKFSSLQRQAYMQLTNLYFQITVLEKQISLYKSAEAVFKRWKILHIPLTIMLFIAVNIHIVSIFYYGRVM